MLAVTVHRAKKLEKKGMFGKADPYVLVQLGDQRIKSKTVGNSQNPDWDFTANMNFNGDSRQQLVIEVLDEDVGKDDLLGSTSISMIGILQSQGFAEKWFVLEGCKSGEVQVSVQCLAALSRDSSKPPSVISSKPASRASSKPASKEPSRAPSIKSVEIVAEEDAVAPGKITINVFRAKKLDKKGMFGKADPYVRATLGSQVTRSQTINNNQNPEWNWESSLMVDSSSPRYILFEVFDDDMGKDDLLGRALLDTRMIVRERSLLDKWVPLESCKSGEILLSAVYKPTLASRSSSTRSLGPVRGELAFSVFQARDLEKDGLWGKADPYVLVTLGDQKAKSGTVGNTQNPIWNFTANLMVDETTPQNLLLEVYDADLGKDDLLGKTFIDVRNIAERKQLFDQWTPLQGCKSGEVLLAATFRPLGSQTLMETPVTVEQVIPVHGQRDQSSDSDSDSSDDEGQDIKILNNRMIGCMDKVRLLQQAKQAFAGGLPEMEDRSDDIAALKHRYEGELADWKEKYTTSLGDAADAKERAGHLGNQNLELGDRLNEKENRLKEREAVIATLEGEVADLLGKLNLLENKRQREIENEETLNREIERLKAALEDAREDLAREKASANELSAKLHTTEKDLNFKIKVLEEQLEQERRRTTLDFSDRDFKMKSEYEKRLKSELKGLRKKYRQETERTKNEFMNLHLKKIGDLQQELSDERMNNSSAKQELMLSQARLEEYKKKIAGLEETNLGLGQKADTLANSLEEEGSVFRAQLRAKNEEVEVLQGGLVGVRQDYQDMVAEKLALDTEIAVYKRLIDAMDKRLRGGLLSNGSLKSLIDDEIEAAVEEKKKEKSSSSESEGEEDSGIFTKIKEKATDVFD